MVAFTLGLHKFRVDRPEMPCFTISGGYCPLSLELTYGEVEQQVIFYVMETVNRP